MPKTPIDKPPKKNGSGRPQHEATKENRDRVMWRRAMGWSDSDIADELGICRNTLYLRYAHELKVAKLRKQGEAMDLLVSHARQGNASLIKALFVIMNQQVADKVDSTDAKSAEKMAAKLGKKEIADIQAKNGAIDTSWEDKMRRIQEIGTAAPAVPKREGANGSAGGPPPTVN